MAPRTNDEAPRNSRLSHRAVTALEALDRDTRALYERLRAARCNVELSAALECRLADTQGTPLNVRVVLVPGILYRDYPETGADGALLREVCEQLELPFSVVPVDGTEGIENAAVIIQDTLRHLPGTEPVLLFSLSKGSAEVRHALENEPGHTAFLRVSAWVSVSGLPFGTPSAEIILRRALTRAMIRLWCWVKGWKLEVIRDLLRHRPHAPFPLPPHICFVQIAAFPLQTDLRDRRSRRLRRQLAALGPNDGFALLDELANLPGLFHPMWGADHYLNGAGDLKLCLARLIRFLGSLSSTSAKS